jgi:hypothetical protein
LTTFFEDNEITGKESLEIPRTIMPSGVTYHFSLTAKNFLNPGTYLATAVVTKQGVAKPRVNIIGPPIVKSKRSRAITLMVNASSPGCGSSNSGLKMLFSWSIINNKGGVSPINSQFIDFMRNPKSFRLLPYALDFDDDVSVQVLVTMADDPQINNTATTRLALLQSDLVATIENGNRVLGTENSFDLKANLFDPDSVSGLPISSKWSCTKKDGSSCAGSGSWLSTIVWESERLVFDVGSIIGGDYIFSIDFTKGISGAKLPSNLRTASTKVAITIKEGSPPTVSINSDPKKNPDVKNSLVATGITSKVPSTLKLQWSFAGQDNPSITIPDICPSESGQCKELSHYFSTSTTDNFRTSFKCIHSRGKIYISIDRKRS